ncbi:MAG: DUF5112 domain-containing protein, partial [Prevotella sp.]|nr:DUF5112 domain-containing protein [Prevotella sp.]
MLPRLVYNCRLRIRDCGRRVCFAIIPILFTVIFFSACVSQNKREIDRLNEISYSFHYRNLDSTRIYAERALEYAGRYEAGKAE